MEMNLLDLPEECIAAVISFTSPHDACRISAVSRLLKSAADSDVAWERFLLADSRLFIDHSLSRFSNKQLFFCFCESPLLIDDGRTSFWMEKRSGKKCFDVICEETRDHLGRFLLNTGYGIRFRTRVCDRFEEVAALLMVYCWFEIRGKISTLLLSKGTIYGAYLVYKEQEMGAFGFQSQALETRFGSTRTVICNDRRVFLEPGYASRSPREEIELGEYYVGCVEEELEMRVLEIREGGWKGGIIGQGIEIRPKANVVIQ